MEGGRGSDTMTWPGSGSSGQKGRRSIGKVEVRVVVGRRRGESEVAGRVGVGVTYLISSCLLKLTYSIICLI